MFINVLQTTFVWCHPFIFWNMRTHPQVRLTVSGYSFSVWKWVIVHFDCYWAEQDQPVWGRKEQKSTTILNQAPVTIPPTHKIICMVGGSRTECGVISSSSWVSWPETMNIFSFLFWVRIYNHTWLLSFLINLVVLTLLSHLHVSIIIKEAVACHFVPRRDFSRRCAIITLIMEFLNSIYCSNFLRSLAAQCFSRLFFIKMPSTRLSLLHLKPETRAGNTINHRAEWRQLDQLSCTERGELKKDLSEAERKGARGGVGERE